MTLNQSIDKASERGSLGFGGQYFNVDGGDISFKTPSWSSTSCISLQAFEQVICFCNLNDKQEPFDSKSNGKNQEGKRKNKKEKGGKN